jgi:hypothetical protein
MSEQTLIPFKAKFILSVNTTTKKFFKDSDEISLEEKYNPVADELGNVDVAKFIKHHHYSSNAYNDYKQFDFKFHKALEVHPENIVMNAREYNSITFKVESFEVEVLQITDSGKEITFADSGKELKTIQLDDNLKLVKV